MKRRLRGVSPTREKMQEVKIKPFRGWRGGVNAVLCCGFTKTISEGRRGQACGTCITGGKGGKKRKRGMTAIVSKTRASSF